MRVLAIAAHADDETLGCGGALLHHRSRGDDVHWLLLTGAWEPRWTRETIERKVAQVEDVRAAYGCRLHEGGFAAGMLDTVPVGDLMRAIEAVVGEVGPRLVYVVDGGDVHTDHDAAFRATMSVLKPFRMAALGVRRILTYETLSSTEAAARPTFVPNVYTDISTFLERKLEIMSLYGTELQPEPGPRSASAIRALARYRGATVGVEFAEAFGLVRELV